MTDARVAPAYDKDGVTLYLGDCLEIMPQLPPLSLDCVIADPPYSLNTKSAHGGEGKLSKWADLCNSAFWYTAWLTAARRLLRTSGGLWAFLNWRSMVTFQKAACDARWDIESLLVWNKLWIGPGGHRGLRPSYELVALWAGEGFAIPDRGIADIRECLWSANKPSGHPAEKPVALVSWLIGISSAMDAVVLDPFMGSGTTGVACVQTGRKFIGIEIDPGYFEIAVKRISEAQMQPRLLP